MQNTQSTEKESGGGRQFEKYIRNQLIRCPCGNILAGYDGHNLTIRKKGRSVAVASSQANIKSPARTAGAESTSYLMGRPSIHGQWQETALEIKTIDRADEFRRPFGNMDFRQQMIWPCGRNSTYALSHRFEQKSFILGGIWNEQPHL